MSKPRILMFAGPNGSGKSTVTTFLKQQPNFPENYANADEVAQSLAGDAMLNSYEAARIVEQQRLTWVNTGQSFAFETVMSHPSKLIQLQQAKVLGYQIEIYFISTIDPGCNILRVQDRVAAGGHDVPVQKIIERYHRSLELLPLAIEIADAIVLFDNTEMPIEVARGGNGLIHSVSNRCPTWGASAIAMLQQRTIARQTLNAAYQNGQALISADVWSGVYHGNIINADSHFLVQDCEGMMVLHDRLLVKGDYQVGEARSIQYREGMG